jgi:molecular chaperone GrpE
MRGRFKKVGAKVDQDQIIEDEEFVNETLEEETAEDTGKDEKAINIEEEDNKTKYLRMAADFANYKKRSEREKSNIYAYANEKLITDMLEILDNFDRAFLQETCENDTFVEGMDLIYKQLLEVLKRAGLSEVGEKGQVFDPELHDALVMEASTEVESGQIIQVLKKGYMLNKKVIRHTLVKVAQ